MNDKDIFIENVKVKTIIELEIHVNYILFKVDNSLNLTKTQKYTIMNAIWLFSKVVDL